MCGRYRVAPEEDIMELREIIDQIQRRADAGEFEKMKTGEIFPTDIVPVVADRPRLMKWGFSKYQGNGVVINARAETLDEKPMFYGPQIGRCLIPATGYFEWEKRGKERVKYEIRVGDDPLLYMAGIYRIEKAGDPPVFAILTREPADLIRHIHNRMPVILSREGQAAWMDGERSVGKILSLSRDDVVFAPVNDKPEQLSMF